MEGADYNGTSISEKWTNSSSEAPVYSNPLLVASKLMSYRVGVATLVYWQPVIGFVGLTGNILSFLIMLKPHNRRISCCNYMAALACIDSIILLTAIDYWTTVFENRPHFVTECKVMAWLLQANSFASMTVVLAMTVDRFIAIRWPLRSRIICTTRRTRIAIGCIVVASHLYMLPYYFTAGVLNTDTCVGVITTDRLSIIYNLVNVLACSIVPFVGLLSMNTAIIVTIRTRGKYFQKAHAPEAASSKATDQHTKPEPDQNTSMSDFTNIEPSQDGSSENQPETSVPRGSSKIGSSRMSLGAKEDSSSRDNQLTVMLLLVTFTFLLLTLPQYARYAASVLWNYMSSPQSYADYVLTAHVTNRLFTTNSACNFFLYCLSGTRFRQDLISLFRRNK
jgi:hypothetical protein